jgi:DNA-binding NarL/FixJ family response regulator
MIENRECIMKMSSRFWDAILGDVTKDKDKKCNLNAKSKKLSEKDLKLRKQRYELGENYGDTYFSRREAECMALMLDDKENREIAEELGLSVKTIECYTEKMKHRLGITSKIKLLEKVRNSDFPKFKDEIILAIQRS